MVGPVAPAPAFRRGRRACLPSRAHTYSASARAQPGYGTRMVRMYLPNRRAGPRTTRLSAVLGFPSMRRRNVEPAQEWSGCLADLHLRSQRSTGRTATSTDLATATTPSAACSGQHKNDHDCSVGRGLQHMQRRSKRTCCRRVRGRASQQGGGAGSRTKIVMFPGGDGKQSPVKPASQAHQPPCCTGQRHIANRSGEEVQHKNSHHCAVQAPEQQQKASRVAGEMLGHHLRDSVGPRRYSHAQK